MWTWDICPSLQSMLWMSLQVIPLKRLQAWVRFVSSLPCSLGEAGNSMHLFFYLVFYKHEGCFELELTEEKLNWLLFGMGWYARHTLAQAECWNIRTGTMPQGKKSSQNINKNQRTWAWTSPKDPGARRKRHQDDNNAACWLYTSHIHRCMHVYATTHSLHIRSPTTNPGSSFVAQGDHHFHSILKTWVRIFNLKKI